MVVYGCCGLLFASRFLALAERAPRALRLVRLGAALGLGLIALCIAADSQLGAALVAFNFSILFTLSMVLLGILAIRRKQVAGRYFLVATLFGMVGAASTTLSVWGWLPFNTLTYHGLEYGIIIEATLLALALAHRYNEMIAALSRVTVSRDELSREVAERKQAEEMLRKSESSLNDAQRIAGLGSFVLHAGSGLWESSDMLDGLFGIDRTHEHTLEGWLALLHPEDRPAMADYIKNEVFGQGGDLDREFRIIRHGDRAERWVHGIGKLECNAQGHPLQIHGTIQDITQRKIAEDEIRRLAFYDPLTRLPNRRLLMDRLNQALASSARSGRSGALLFIDLDNFKTLNDTLGHDIGDLLLQLVSRRLTACVREGDTVARLGGDEFVVMLEDLGEHALEAAAQTETIGEKILAALNQPYPLGPHNHHSTPSIGATLFKTHELAMDELLKQADIAMYQAKKAGRNTLRFFDPQMQANITARAALEEGLRHALANNQFELHYQLQATHDGWAVGAEALIRWQRPETGLVSPLMFIPLAEETGLILPLGQWVLETACDQIKRWEGSLHTRHLQLAINVSARQFHQVDFVQRVRLAIDRTGIQPDRLKLELTESLVLDDIDETIRRMHALREVGVRFSMDDFGTGYSSLSSLKKLPISQLKIDQSFVRDITNDPDGAIIVQTIIAMAINLGMEVIAEGVETEEQRAFLEQHGCPLCQGYLFGKPMPAEQFEALLLRS
ncbi:cyclic di-GMP phosphodiesterase Gmr [mine drainage metagenome]|uniref:Cyclic di-GMP phosphodiesterase Gmr n=1 Tax=mine drainage metagenome TaxID=410659 RepID=A0A1J5R441_9ZZZZ